MKVIVASKNEAKIEAVKEFFGDFLGRKVKVEGINVNSGVSGRPIGIDVFLGTIHRLRNAINKADGAKYYVAIEGGYFKFADEHFIGTIASMCTADGISAISTGIGDFYKIPKSAFDCIAADISLNTIITDYEHSNYNNYKQTVGLLGFLTDGKISRKDDSLQALTRMQEDVINKWKWDCREELPNLLEEGRIMRLENEKYFLLDRLCTEKLKCRESN